MTETETRQLHDAFCGAGRMLSTLVWWFEDFLKGFRHDNGTAIPFSRYGECGDCVSTGSLTWQMEEPAVGASGKFRIRADLVLHHPDAALRGELHLPVVIWQVLATSTRQSQRLDLNKLVDYPWFSDAGGRGSGVPHLEYVDESNARSSFYRRVYLTTSPSSICKSPDTYRTCLYSMITAMQGERFQRSSYHTKFAQL